jgi:soluble lytic murein transglycosylase-like protein
MYADARALYREALAVAAPAWRGLAFRGWLEASAGLEDWQGIVDGAAELRQVAGTGQGQAGTTAEDQANDEAGRRALVDALANLERWDEAWTQANAWRSALSAAADGPLGIGDIGQPAWLPYQLARLGLRRTSGPVFPLGSGLKADILPYALGVEAREGHGEILRLLDEAVKPAPSADAATAIGPGLARNERSLLELLRAKELLARNQPVEAWRIFGSFLPGEAPAKPPKKATKATQAAYERSKADWEATRDRLADLAGLHREAGLGPAMFIRDCYNAARLAGRFTEGMAFLDQIRRELIVPEADWRDSAAVPYLLELKGRLARAAGKWQAAADCFSEALPLAVGLETRGALNAEDRRRVQWYLLSSLAESSDDFSGPLFDLDRFLETASATDSPEYFADALEEAQLKIARRADWKALERFDRELAAVLPPLLHWRGALILARVSQLAAPGKTDANERFQDLSRALAGQTDSLYYQLVARWMRGEPSDLAALLASRPGLEAFAAPETGDLDWAETVAQGYWDMGMTDAAMEFAWEHRASLSAGFLVRLGAGFETAGRMRQGLRLIDSARLRAGHPADKELLAAYYPRPYATEMAAAVSLPQAAAVPEWLFYALARTESLFDPGAASGPGARGLAQLMPATARAVAKGLKIEAPDLDDPAVNLKLGTVFLADQFRTLGRWPQALAAYNAGAGRVRSWQKAGMGDDPIIFSELVPFEETRNYIRRIIEGAAVYAWLYYGTEAGSTLSILYTPGATFRQ